MTRRASFFRVSAGIIVLLGCTDPPLEPPVTAPEDDPVRASAATLGAPDNTIASGVSETQIAVGWRDNSNTETQFEVYAPEWARTAISRC